MTSRVTRRDFCRWTLAGASLAMLPLRGKAATPREVVHEFTVSRASNGPWPDGVEKRGGMLLVNGRLPGPTIRARQGDTLVVRLRNGLDEPTTIHWHGMTQQGTWEMDGVAFVSQDPIPPGEVFEYRFVADPPGTHLWHSHTGLQYGEGMFGMLIVDPVDDPDHGKYDVEALVCVNDWLHEPGPDVLARLTRMKPMAMAMDQGPDLGDVPFESALINGKGRYQGSRTPLEVFPVAGGQRVRFRMANIGTTYEMRIRLDGHRMTVIAVDGEPVRPLVVDSVDLDIGERCDVLVEMDQPVGNYWLRASTLEEGVDHGALAVVRYRGAPDGEPPPSPPSRGTELDYNLLRDRLGRPAPEPDVVGVHLLGGSMMPYRWTWDGKAFQLPEQSFRTDPRPPDPPVTQMAVTEGQVVRLVLNNPTGMTHPFHIHGRSFQLLRQSPAGAGNYAEGQPLEVEAPPRKDTVSVHAGGHAVIQWRESNPGFWFFHCHIEWHLATGMAVVIRSSAA